MELAARADELSNSFADLAQEELEFEKVKTAHKNRVSGIQSRMSELARELREKKVPRDVEVEYVTNLEERVLEVFRLDTGELVSTRPLTAGELQLRLLEVPKATAPESATV